MPSSHPSISLPTEITTVLSMYKVILWCLNPHLHNCGNLNFIQSFPLSLKKVKNFLVTIQTSFFTRPWALTLYVADVVPHYSQGTGMSDILHYTCQAGPNPRAVWAIVAVMTSMNYACCVHNLCNVSVVRPTSKAESLPHLLYSGCFATCFV